MDQGLDVYIPIFIYMIVILIIVGTTLVLAHLIGPSRKTAVKQMPYESGMDPIGDARQRFDVKFYLIAIMFLVFDVELLFLYPWAVAAYRDPAVWPTVLARPIFWSVIVFLALLLVGFIYDWRKGVFKWR